MFVRWRASPALPGAITNRITVSEAKFQLDHFQVLGDAGNDNRTTRFEYLLTWDNEKTPTEESFPEAPVGMYSKISLVLRSGDLGDSSYEIKGTWIDDDMESWEFEISDSMRVNISLNCRAMVPAAGSARLAIRLDLLDALAGIDFTQLDEDDGELELKNGPELVAFRNRLTNAFKLDE